MGYIDKDVMLHEISVKKGQCLKNGWDMLYASLEETEKYVRDFHEAEIEDPVEVFWTKKGENCLVRIDDKFYEARTIAEAAADWLRAQIYEKEKEV